MGLVLASWDAAKHTGNKYASEYASAQIQPYQVFSDSKSAHTHDKEMGCKRNFSAESIKATSCIHPQQKWRPKHFAWKTN